MNQQRKEILALALLLWKDFMTEGKPPNEAVDLTRIVFEFAQDLEIFDELQAVMSRLPPMKVEPR